MARAVCSSLRWGFALAVASILSGCSPLSTEDDSESTPATGEGGAGSELAAECPSVEDFQEVCDCDAVELSWAGLGLEAGVSLSELLTIFVEGDAESVAAAVCDRALGRGDIVDTHVYPLGGRTDGSSSVSLDLGPRDGLVGYSILSGDQARSLGFAYFVVSHDSTDPIVSLEPWED